MRMRTQTRGNTTDLIVHEFPAMGGTVEVQLVDRGAAEVAAIESLFAEHEGVMSRFLLLSELCALNASAPAPFVASPILFDVVRQALDWAHITGGVFDPTVIDVLNNIGYDRSFELVGDQPPPGKRQVIAERGWHSIGLDEDRRAIALPEGVAIDLGGIGKGYTVDRAIELLGPGANAIVNASGDLRVAGGGPSGDGWRIGVQDPFTPTRHLAVLSVRDRAVATSGSARRQWHIGTTRHHHLIDAGARASAQSDLLTVTVVASTATEADVLAKVGFLLGSALGPCYIARLGAEAIAVALDGRIITTAGVSKYLAPPANEVAALWP